MTPTPRAPLHCLLLASTLALASGVIAKTPWMAGRQRARGRGVAPATRGGCEGGPSRASVRTA